YLLFRRRGSSTASTRSRALVFGTRTLAVVLLVLAASAPYTVVTKETPGDPRVTFLVDESDSMAVSPSVADRVVEDVEAAGVPVTRTTIASGTQSPVGEGIAANLRENGTVVVLSDGQVTGGQSLRAVAETAASLNATVSTVRVEPDRTERVVQVFGPSKASAGVENQFLVRVTGVETDFGTPTLEVSVDGETVTREPLENGTADVVVSHTFEETGPHRVTASVSTGDRFSRNDVFYRSVRVVERPDVLYVSRGNYSFRQYLDQLYDVQTARTVPEDLDQYYAVVMQDLPAEDVGNVGRLQEYVIDGNGLVVVGGRNSFERGGYAASPLGSMLPVRIGEGGVGTANIVLLVDISKSTAEGMTVQKALALDVLDQLGDENQVGIVAFNYNAFDVADLQPLSRNRAALENKIRRLQSGGATKIATGLLGAEEQLGGERGTIILISDGGDRPEEATAVARQLGRDGIRVVAVGAGSNPNERTLRSVASASGGTYVRATETNRLRLLFGGASRQFEGEKLTVVDANHFVTAGVTFESNPPRANDVSMKSGADFLVAASDGTPAVASWRYGLGRVVTVTAYGEDGGLDGLLQRPDSLVLTKSVNYAIGDPERKESGVASVPDTRVGETTTVTYRGDQRPAAGALSFRRVGEGVYRADLTPNETGYQSVLGTEYAANYPREYDAFGPSPELEALVASTGGRQFSPAGGERIAELAREQATRVREVRQSWTWLLVLLGLMTYLIEVVWRRIQVYMGRTRSEGGLP
ncbi:MAG: VWA domain-containing protein, partial [Haloferacaceae archaeon]